MTLKKELAFVNGSWVPRKEATISIDDRGFRYGDGVFETIRVHNSKAYQLPLHLQRLSHGLQSIHISFDANTLEAHVNEIIEKNNIDGGMVRIIITRGSGKHGYLPSHPHTPSVVITTSLLTGMPTGPASLWLSDYQKPSKELYPGHCKTLQGLQSTLARIEAEQHHCSEALLCNQSGYIAECSSHNIFWTKDNTLFTPALSSGIVDGTIRNSIIRLSPLEVKEGLYEVDVLKEADAVFITNCLSLCRPVEKLLPRHWKGALMIWLRD
jgi:aminodeoxychorismate lyase